MSGLFDKIAPVYALFYNYQKKYFSSVIDIAKKDINITDFHSVVDIGAGIGALSSVLNSKGMLVTATDTSKNMLRVGASKVENRNIDFVYSKNPKKLPFDDKSFDISICSYVAHGLKQEERINLYNEMMRVSRHYVIIHDYNEKRAILTDVVEYLENGDYFNFIKNAKGEMAKTFDSLKVIELGDRAAWYVGVPK